MNMTLNEMIWYVNYKEFSDSWRCYVHCTEWFKTETKAIEFASTVLATQIAKFTKE